MIQLINEIEHIKLKSKMITCLVESRQSTVYPMRILLSTKQRHRRTGQRIEINEEIRKGRT